MSFPNEYLHRTANRESPCFVCGKFSSAVLTTADDSDWFYVCVSHIADPDFATCLNTPQPPAAAVAKQNPAPPKEEPAAAAAAEKKPQVAPDYDHRVKAEGTNDEAADRTKQQQPAPAPAPAPSGPRRYRLDRNIFYLREAEQRKRKQQKAAREVSSRLPSVPPRGF